MAKKILITGGAGFIGSHLARKLLNEGNEITVIDNLFTGSKANIKDLMHSHNFTFIHHDVTKEFWGQFDEIYNLACPASPIHYQRNPVETAKSSILGTIHVLELALKTKAKVLHASTSEVYGDPLQHPQTERYWGNVNPIGARSCYDEGKRAVETLCADFSREYNVDVRVARIFNTYGPNMHPNDGRVVSNFIMQALHNKDITVYGDGKQTRSFQYVDDLVEALVRYMQAEKKELAEKFSRHGWHNIPVLNLGNPKEFTIAKLAEKVLKLVPESKSRVVFKELPKDDPRQRKPDISMAKSIIGWQPKVRLEHGLKNTISYFRKNYSTVDRGAV
jgi:UDP-glucuronate decarboxylase